MAISNITTEDGNKIVQETVAGITGASSLNDTQVEVIEKETFTTDPSTRGWLWGSGWTYNVSTGRMEAT